MDGVPSNNSRVVPNLARLRCAPAAGLPDGGGNRCHASQDPYPRVHAMERGRLVPGAR